MSIQLSKNIKRLTNISSEMESDYFFDSCEQLIPRGAELKLLNHFNKFAFVLDDIVNFGSQVLCWKPERLENEEYIAVPLTLLRESLDLTDSCAILLRKGSADSAKIITRSLFEIFLSVRYICKDDTKKRSYAYMVSSILDDIKYHSSVVEKYSNAGDAVGRTLDKDQVNEIVSLISGKESIFLLPGYKDAYQYYCTETANRKQKKNNRKLDNWYSYYNGPRNLRELAGEVGAGDAYTFFYSKYSKMTHGNESFLGKMISTGEHSADMVQLRSFTDLESVFHYTFMFATSILKIYLSSILPERNSDLQLFSSWSGQQLDVLIKKGQ